MFDLTGQVAVITGSSRGIGRAIAERMAQAGARVVISSRKADACRVVADAICAGGGEAMSVPCNVSDKAQLQALTNTVLAAWGKIDILVCNAATNPYYGPLAKITDEAFDKTMNNNVRSSLWLCNMAVPQMAERGKGCVILISSVAGMRGDRRLGAYGISKSADIGLVMNLAVEWGPRNVRVNAIAPGIINTDFAKPLWDNPAIYARTIEMTPLGRIGDPDDVAGVAVFLASRAGEYITGQTLVVDGGATIAGTT